MKHAAQAALEAVNIGELLGIEGAAALVYFENFAGTIKLADDPDEAIVGEQKMVRPARRRRRVSHRGERVATRRGSNFSRSTSRGETGVRRAMR